ncbi:unnamed protein product [Macrosiphum euphorbiae]|uniref:Uncharacterized protein n=1 Tax=Macrosiphum euphorbiae TaxID=13131 RepID=A0AAV0XTG5_9HEMI|nr:unnamed protein product [Macrosiphum euphorbiae]
MESRWFSRVRAFACRTSAGVFKPQPTPPLPSNTVIVAIRIPIYPPDIRHGVCRPRNDTSGKAILQKRDFHMIASGKANIASDERTILISGPILSYAISCEAVLAGVWVCGCSGVRV